MQKVKHHFIHINKTAGSSVIEWFKQNKYPIINRDTHAVPKIFSKDTVYFTVIRHPYERTLSQFLHWQKNLGRIKSDLTFQQYLTVIENPREWLNDTKYLDNYRPLYIRPCSDWIPKDKKILIFRYENLTELVDYFKNTLNFTKKFPHSQKTRTSQHSKGLHLYYNPKCYRIVNKIMNDDFKRFGYQKHGC